jgi:putative membrane protein
MLAFVEHGVNRTREQNGVLLFASLYERKVVVLGDRAVHEKLGDQHWKRAVDTLVTGIKSGDPAEGFCKAIADIGEEMAKAFPRGSAPQSNEISDELRVDR